MEDITWTLETGRFYHIGVSDRKVFIDGVRVTWWKILWWGLKITWLIIIGKEPFLRDARISSIKQ